MYPNAQGDAMTAKRRFLGDEWSRLSPERKAVNIVMAARSNEHLLGNGVATHIALTSVAAAVARKAFHILEDEEVGIGPLEAAAPNHPKACRGRPRGSPSTWRDATRKVEGAFFLPQEMPVMITRGRRSGTRSTADTS